MATSRAIIAARKVYADCGISNPNEIPIEVILESKNIVLKEDVIEGADGRIVMGENSAVVTLNSLISLEAKRRFVLAHELGHFELHRNVVGFVDNNETLVHSYHSKFAQKEVEANEFTSEFLMPSELYLKEYKRLIQKQRKFSHKIIHALATYFDVSKTACILKFVALSPHPVFVLCCQDNKMKWFKRSHDWRLYSLFERGLPPPSGTVASEVFDRGLGYFDEDSTQKIWKSDWFELKNYEQDKEIYEYCLFVPSYNYMISLIWED